MIRWGDTNLCMDAGTGWWQGIFLSTCNANAQGQLFNTVPVIGDSSWMLIKETVSGSARCLDVPAWSTAAGVAISLYTCGIAQPNQMFTQRSEILLRTAGALENRNSKMCIENKDGLAVVGNPLQQGTCWVNPLDLLFGKTQRNRFVFVPASPRVQSPPPRLPPPSPLPGMLRRSSVLVRLVGSSLCWDAGAGANWQKISLSVCNRNRKSQLFDTLPVSGDTAWMLIKETVSGSARCLDLPDRSTVLGEKIQLYSCGDQQANQLFRLLPTTPGGSSGEVKNRNSDLCIDNTNGQAVVGNLLQQWACSGTANANDANRRFSFEA